MTVTTQLEALSKVKLSDEEQKKIDYMYELLDKRYNSRDNITSFIIDMTKIMTSKIWKQTKKTKISIKLDCWYGERILCFNYYHGLAHCANYSHSQANRFYGSDVYKIFDSKILKQLQTYLNDFKRDYDKRDDIYQGLNTLHKLIKKHNIQNLLQQIKTKSELDFNFTFINENDYTFKETKVTSLYLNYNSIKLDDKWNGTIVNKDDSPILFKHLLEENVIDTVITYLEKFMNDYKKIDDFKDECKQKLQRFFFKQNI